MCQKVRSRCPSLQSMAMYGVLAWRKQQCPYAEPQPWASAHAPLLPFVFPEADRKILGFDPLEKSVSMKDACIFTAAGTGTEMMFTDVWTVLDTEFCRRARLQQWCWEQTKST